MAPRHLHVTIRTPREVVLDTDAASLRVPTQTGQVGLRPRSEPTIVAVEPGLIVVRRDGVAPSGKFHYAGTAGGLLHCDGESVTLLTPLGVAGDDLASVTAALHKAMDEPTVETEIRQTLGRLETRILQELHGEDRSSPRGPAS
jgi:F0F1-type ATP synthase epsilon subunit